MMDCYSLCTGLNVATRGTFVEEGFTDHPLKLATWMQGNI